jgi:LacI family transcriptional regulator
MPTIHDVARRAGVAPITVSRVINNSGYYSQEILERVEAAISELGYVPNTLARSLRSKRTNTLALVLTDITNPFFTTLARGVEDTASDAGFTVIFCNTDESQAEEQKYLHVLVQKQVDGILLVPSRSTADSIEFIHKHNTPVVVLDRRVPNAQTDVVRADSQGGAYQLTRLLLGLGHRHVAILSGPRDVSTAEDRVAGYQQAMAEAGIPEAEKLVCYGAFTQESGYEMVKQALTATPQLTALFAANNFIGIGALKALQDLGLRVPEDIALVAFDDLPPALVTFPFFTLAAQPAYEMGKKATELLLSRLAGEASGPYQEIILPTELIVRQSSGQQRAITAIHQ